MKDTVAHLQKTLGKILSTFKNLLGLVCITLFSARDGNAGTTENPLRLGAALLYAVRSTDAEENLSTYSPEVLASYSFPLSRNYEIRPSVRINLLWATQDTFMPQSIRMSERDIRITGEAALVHLGNGYAACLSLGGGVIDRHTEFKTSPPLTTSENSIGGKTVFSFVTVQTQFMFPVLPPLEIGPSFRYIHVFGDPRLTAFVGFEASLKL